jgi:HD-like signal output (HDOD) protein
MDLERLFVLGLLADVGHMVIYMRIPDQVAKLDAVARNDATPLHQLETQHLDCNYADTGGALLQRWRLPESIWQPIGQQISPAPGQPHALESALLNIVSALVQAKCGYGDLANLVEPAAWEISGLAPEQALEALSDAENAIDDMASIFADQKAA